MDGLKTHLDFCLFIVIQNRAEELKAYAFLHCGDTGDVTQLKIEYSGGTGDVTQEMERNYAAAMQSQVRPSAAAYFPFVSSAVRHATYVHCTQVVPQEME